MSMSIDTSWSGKKFSEVEGFLKGELTGKLTSPQGGGAVGNVLRKVSTGTAWGTTSEVIQGYYHGGTFYADSLHTTPLEPVSGNLYIDLPSGTEFLWGGSSYSPVGGITDAPGDSGVYGRQGGSWVRINDNSEVVTVHVTDSTTALGIGGVDVYELEEGVVTRSVQTDISGHCSFAVPRSVAGYTIQVASPTGYAPTAPRGPYVPSYFVRQENFALVPGVSEVMRTLTVRYTVGGGTTFISYLEGKIVSLSLTGSRHSILSMPIINGAATFKLNEGSTVVSVTSPSITNYTTPTSPAQFVISGDTEIPLDYVKNVPRGIYVSKCNAAGTELTDITETELDWAISQGYGPGYFLGEGEEFVAFHIDSASWDPGYDYYIPISVINRTLPLYDYESTPGMINITKELASGSTSESPVGLKEGPWMSEGTWRQEVQGMTDWNGIENTTMMINFAQDNGCTTIARWARKLAFLSTGMYGFIPTRFQADSVMVNTGVFESVMRKLSLTNKTFSSKSWWSSTQSDATNARWFGYGTPPSWNIADKNATNNLGCLFSFSH